MRQSDCAPRDAVDRIEIQSPCTVSWDEMSGGDGRVRYCGHCRQNVYNIEAMSRGEAHRLISVREGRVCVRILRRPDGTVVTADCWSRLRAARRRGFLPFLGMLVLVGFTELIAIGAGLARLKGMLGGPPPAPPPVSLPIARGLVVPPPPMMGEPRPPAPSRELGDKAPSPPRHVKRHVSAPQPPQRDYFMGAAMDTTPTDERSNDATDFLGGL